MKIHGLCASLIVLGMAWTWTSCSRSSKALPSSEPTKPAPSAQPLSAPAAPEARAALVAASPLSTPPANAQHPDRVLLSGHTAEIHSVVFSPDRRWLATGSADKTIRIWDLATARSIHTLAGHTESVQTLAFSSDGRWLASSSQDGAVRVWDTSSWKSLYGLNSDLVPEATIFSPDNQLLVISGEKKGEESEGAVIKVYAASSGGKLREFELEWNRAQPIVVTADGRLLSSGGQGEDGDVDVTTKVWNVQTGQELKSLPALAQAISSDGQWIASFGSGDGPGRSIALWNLTTGAKHTIETGGGFLANLSFTPDSTRLLGTEASGSLKAWNVATGKVLSVLQVDKNYPNALALSSDGTFLAVANYSAYSATIWDLAAARVVNTLQGQSFSGFVAFDRNGRLLVSEPSGLRALDVATGEEIAEFPGVAGGGIAFNNDGGWLASNPNGIVKLWDTKTWAPARLTPEQSNYIWSVGFTGIQISPAVANSGVQSWKSTDNHAAPTVLGYTYAMAVNHDGSVLAVGQARGGNVDIWDLASATKLTTFSAHKLSVNKLEFSPDGRFLLSAGQETPFNPAAGNAGLAQLQSSVKLWDVKTWQENTSIPYVGMGLGGGTFSMDGRLLALMRGSGTIDIFDIGQSKTVRELAYENYAGGNVAFSPDGNWVALFTQHGVDVWNIAPPAK